ncbi:MAG: phosphate ABC transporter permease subunit PstC [Treponema sp.]|nr:phosphate ABC transporter permease subunit PstC [Treponema sp.]MCL2272509.1 phosphate ABC transporter permease subunit PstC [Treponema sp.]
MNRKITDIFFKHLVSIIALFSVLALTAILLFVFAQGAMPFFVSTSAGVRLVAQRIDELTVNGNLYVEHSTFIDIPKETELVSIRFPSGEDIETLDIAIDNNEKDPLKKLKFSHNNDVNITYPESYVYTVSWPAAIASLEKRIHIILPEPPYNAWSFLSGIEWRPSRDKVFGIFPMIAGTLLASLGAILIGVPIALLCALFMAEFLKPKPASVIRAGVELLAGIPSVVYGFFGLMVIVPFVRGVFDIPSGNTLLSAIIVLALMILPTVITIAETSLRAVPLSVREASLSLGASKMQTAWRVVLPHANSGVIAGVILGISRAVGETMAVILVAGNSPQLTINPLESVRTLTSTIAMEMGYASGRHSEMLFSIGVTLFSIILILNSVILWYRRKVESEL